MNKKIWWMNEKPLPTRQSIAIASGHFCSSRYCSGNPQVIVILKVVEGYLQQQGLTHDTATLHCVFAVIRNG